MAMMFMVIEYLQTSTQARSTPLPSLRCCVLFGLEATFSSPWRLTNDKSTIHMISHNDDVDQHDLVQDGYNSQSTRFAMMDSDIQDLVWIVIKMIILIDVFFLNRHLDWSFFQSSSWLIFFKKIVILIFIWKGENPQGWVDHWTSSLQTLHVEQWWQVLIRVDLYLCHLRATFRATFHVFSSRFYMLRKPLNHTWAVGSPHNSPATRRRNM